MRAARLALTIAAGWVALAAAAQAQPSTPTEQGRRIAERLCGRCHAIDPTAPSRHAKAPPFHEIAGRYKPNQLEEALAEGIVVGHADMPEFTLDPVEIDALLGYMASLKGGAPAKRR